MTTKEYLEKVAYVGTIDNHDEGDPIPVYKSKFDCSYLTHVGQENNVDFLAKREITEELTHGVGFSPKDNKWYGWSHRAIFGFEPGSTCVKGDCHYRAANLEDEIEVAISFWSDEDRINTRAEQVEVNIIKVIWEYTNDIPNKEMRGKINSVDWYFDPEKYGNGEWIAETMEDAKQMAIDFNEGVS